MTPRGASGATSWVRGFLDPADLRTCGWRDGRPLFTTLAPLRYASPSLGMTLVIPAEFITDLASVPRLPLTWWLAGGRGPRPAILHDFAYQFGAWPTLYGPTLSVPKRVADDLFYEALRIDPWSGAGPVSAYLMWASVRIGGRGIWKSNRVEIINPEWAASGVPRQEAP